MQLLLTELGPKWTDLSELRPGRRLGHWAHTLRRDQCSHRALLGPGQQVLINRDPDPYLVLWSWVHFSASLLSLSNVCVGGRGEADRDRQRRRETDRQAADRLCMCLWNSEEK